MALGSMTAGAAFAVQSILPPSTTTPGVSAPTAHQSSPAAAHGAQGMAGQGAALGLFGAACVGASMSRRAAKKSSKAAKRTQVKATMQEDYDFVGVCDQTGVTLNRYMLEMYRKGAVDEDMQSIFNSIREACKVIANLVNRAPLRQAELLGLQGEVNVQGEDQKKLDVITNDVLKKALQYTGKLGTIASEEEDAPVPGETGVPDLGNEAIMSETGKYVCVFDPLDGSSNVDAGIAVGTIFGVFKESEDNECVIPSSVEDLSDAEAACLAQTLQPGKALVAAGYVLYSSSVELVFTLGSGVVGFTLDESIGEFVLSRPSIVIPERGQPIYSANEANISEWDEPMRQYIRDIQQGKGETGKKYSLRYIGSMVGDVHRTLLYGGLFAYPADSKNQDGKLRLLYEAAPMSFIVEQAGGKSITGHSRVMDIPPVAVHQRVPIILGSKADVEECQKYYEKSDDPALKERCMKRLNPVPEMA
eukprot:CAMPEP_0178421046 /NCGR_PEP_ID=MMETSP0689_2-20121128/26448_1 /TAXON_ID=160604 /ORGANISM="Amphidinium massartii, Strain CS-259" /LENGTH=474 /DNA_ID=CAMNT_0020042551 /DNA_START=138 /DNA_END=1562 /DNA_ORIENTATION=-